MKRAHKRKPTNISLPVELVEEARALDINLSRELEAHLTAIVKARRAEQWRRENRKAIEAYNKFIDEHGIWDEGFRQW